MLEHTTIQLTGRIRRLAGLAVLSLCCAVAQAEHYTVPLLVPAGASGEPQGVLRILNATEEAGAVEIYAIDDAGTRTGPATFTLNVSSVAEFTATDLESGNAGLGLTGGIGTQVGDARLEIETDLRIVPLAFVRAADGTLSAMHDTVRGVSAGDSGQSVYEVPVFNPSTAVTQASRLRLINPGDEAAAVTIAGLDDNGAEASGGDVSLTLAAGGAQTLTAQQLEAGDESVTGGLGAGAGKWRLTVSSDRPLEVINIVASAAGYLNNLSTTAVPGPAPADLGAFNARIAGKAVVSRTTDALATLVTATGEQFTETVESDGVTSTHTGGYGYAGIGPNAGRLTLVYDGGDVCASNLYFASRTSGWFASHCTGSDYPAEGTWLGGNWWVEDDEDDDGDGTVMETTYEVDEALPGVPTSGFFIPAVTGGGSRVSASAAGTTISLDDGGYFELNDGTRYTCAATGGCTVVNGVVTAGAVSGREAGTGEVDRFPSFRTADSPGNQSYTVGTAIDTLTLPEASGGDGALSYSLSPAVPGLTFNAGTRQLSGTPSTAGAYTMIYSVADEDGDTDSLGFTVTVNDGTTEAGSLGVCQVGMMLGSGQRCTYPGTTDAFSVNVRGRGSFLGRLAGIRIRINNETIDGRVYDFEASHQGDGVWRIDRIAGSTEVPTDTGIDSGTDTGADTNSIPSFATDAGPGNQAYSVRTAIDTLTLPEASGGDGTLTYSLSPEVPGLIFNASTRQLTGTPTAVASYNMTYTVTDEDGDTDSLGFSLTVTRVGTVFIPDANLRAAIATALGKSSDARITYVEMASLTSLQAHVKRISNLTGLEAGINLTRLVIWGNRISDISALSGLTKLEELWLGQNNITDISPLANLTNLRKLSVGDANISNLSVLSRLTNLTELRLLAANVSDLSSLSGLTNLKSLILSHNKIEDLSPLAGLSELTELWLYENNIEDISTLSGLVNLERLSIALNNVSDISALSGLTNLTVLWLNDNNISILSSLSGLINVTWLNLGFNNIADVSALSGLTDLIELDLSINNIGDISALLGLTNLEKLNLRGNPVSASSIGEHVSTLQNNGTEVLFDAFGKGDFDIELVLLDDFTEIQQRALQYVARRWMAVIVEDVQDVELSHGWFGTCAGKPIAISPGERIDDLRIYVGTVDRNVGILGHGSPYLLRDETHLPVLGCMAFDLSHANLLTTGLHEIGHVLGFASEVWNEFGYYQNPLDGDTHFTGPLATAAFDEAGGQTYAGAKVPLQTQESHWRIPELQGELMSPYGGETLSAITIQSLADLGYGVDLTQADAYTVGGAASAQASASAANSMSLLSCGLYFDSEPIRVIDQQGRVIRTMGVH